MLLSQCTSLLLCSLVSGLPDQTVKCAQCSESTSVCSQCMTILPLQCKPFIQLCCTMHLKPRHYAFAECVVWLVCVCAGLLLRRSDVQSLRLERQPKLFSARWRDDKRCCMECWVNPIDTPASGIVLQMGCWLNGPGVLHSVWEMCLFLKKGLKCKSLGTLLGTSKLYSVKRNN